MNPQLKPAGKDMLRTIASLSLCAIHDLRSIDLTTLHAQLKYVEYVTAAQPIQFDIQSSHRASH